MVKIREILRNVIIKRIVTGVIECSRLEYKREGNYRKEEIPRKADDLRV